MNGFELVRLAFHEIEFSPGFDGWLDELDLSLAVTNGNRLFLIGRGADGVPGVVEKQYGTCTAMAAVGADTIYMATRYQIWRLENALPPGELTDDGHDRLFVPQTAWTTGLLGVHDLAVDASDQLVFVNGRFSCLATVSETLNFQPLWMPPFITALLPEDRCRLTGIAMVGGEPAFATSASRADRRDGWRDHRRDGGVVVAIPGGEVVASGLSMPYSPVHHGGRLWVANGGTGELVVVDPSTGAFDVVTAMPGFVRGLATYERYAAVGVSRPRPTERFDGLAVDERLTRTGEAARCGVFVVDLQTGRLEHWLVLDGVAPDIGGVTFLPGTRSPTSVPFHGEEVEEWVTFPCPEF